MEEVRIIDLKESILADNDADAEKLREELIGRGRELDFCPDFMRVRYENWVNGLNGDWLISRQRFFGVPFPLWYPLDEQGEPDYSSPIVPSEDVLPIDPTIDTPAGYEESQRDVPGGFTAEKDIMLKGAWTEQARMAIMNFLEDYKTAYALKDMNYINQDIF